MEEVKSLAKEPCCSAKEYPHQPIYPHDIRENSLTSLTDNFVFNSPNIFKSGTETPSMVLSKSGAN